PALGGIEALVAALDHRLADVQAGIDGLDGAIPQEREEIAEAATHVEHAAAIEVPQLQQRLEALFLRRAIAEAQPPVVVAVAADLVRVPERGVLRLQGAHGRERPACVRSRRSPDRS